MTDFLKGFRAVQQEHGKEYHYLSQCPFCSMQCTKMIHEEKSVQRSRFTVTPNKKDPVSDGKLCIKGIHACEHALDPRRLRNPLMRKEGKLVPVSWEEALDWFGQNVSRLQNQYGKNAMGVYGGGSLTNEECYLLGKFARVALGTKFIDYNGRFCMSAAATAANQAFGVDRGLTNPLSDILLAKCIILAGTNIADCQPTMMPYLRKAKANGCKVIVIDPRETGTSRIADLHLKVRPGSDAALVNGMLKVLIEEDFVDYSFIGQSSEGFSELYQHIRQVDLDGVARLTGVAKADITAAARIYGEAETGLIYTARGVEQHASGVKNVRNFINMALVTGKIGKPGCGYGAVTGQGNGQGGREHGQKADQLPGYRSLDNPEHRKYVAGVWGIPETELPEKGVSAYEMFEAIDNREIRGLLVLGSNPIVSNPNARLIERALGKLESLVVIDLFLSETAQMADLVLPGSAYLEDEGTMTNLEGRVILRQASRALPEGAKLDWEILCEMAKRLGKGEFFKYQEAKDIFEELRVASKGGVADYSGISYERIREEQGVFWPCPSPSEEGVKTMFTDGRFYHPDGRARFLVVPHQSPAEPVDHEFPLILTTGRVMHHYLSGVQTRHTVELNQKYPAPLLEIHPDKARELRLADGEYAKITSRRGEILLKVKFAAGIRADTVFVPFHWGGEQSINRLTNPALDPQCRMPEFKACAVKVETVNPAEITDQVLHEEILVGI